MSENNGETRDQLIEAKLELIRLSMTKGFEELTAKIENLMDSERETRRRVEAMEQRIRMLEIEDAKSETKLRLMMALMGLGGGSVGAIVSRFMT